MIKTILEYFKTFNINGFYSIGYFLKHFGIYLFVAASIIILIIFELQTIKQKYIDDQRNML